MSTVLDAPEAVLRRGDPGAPAWLRPLPSRAKRHRRETDGSYLRRLLAANHLPPDARRRVLRAASSPFAALAELAPGLHAETEAESAERRLDATTLETGRRWLCRLCARSERVELRQHFGGYACLRHRLWTGPDTPPEAQAAIDDNALNAERTFRRLRSRGRLHEPLYFTLRDALDEHYANSDAPAPGPTHHFTVLVVLLSEVVLNQDFVHDLLDPARTFATAYAVLDNAIRRILGTDATIVVDTVWLLLRPAAAEIRNGLEDHLPQLAVENPEPPVFLRGYLPPSQVPRPLEPFERYLGNLRTCKARRRDDEERTYLTVRRPGAQDKHVFVCSQGHHCEKKLPLILKRPAGGGIGCPYCGNDRALAGFNTIRQTDPARLWEWHPTKNKKLTPDDVTRRNTATLVWWRCAKGHEFQQTPNERLRRRGCQYCSHMRIWPEVNSLAALHPEIAAEWHPELNGSATPDTVHPGTPRRYYWKCPAGHSYAVSVERRVRYDGSCPECRRKTRRIELAASQNGSSRPAQPRDLAPASTAHSRSPARPRRYPSPVRTCR